VHLEEVVEVRPAVVLARIAAAGRREWLRGCLMVGLLEQVEFKGCFVVELRLLWYSSFAFEKDVLLLVCQRI